MVYSVKLAGLVAVLGIGTASAQTAAPSPTTPAPAATSASTASSTGQPAQTAGTPGGGAAPAAAVAPARVTAGASIVDASGAPVGTVAQVSGTVALVDTGTNKVGVPTGNFSQGANGLILGNTKAELDAAATQAAAQSEAQLKTMLVAGTDVHGVNGQVIGKVKQVASEFITVTSSKGGDVRLPRSGFGVTPAGLTVGIAQADFDKAVAGSRK